MIRHSRARRACWRRPAGRAGGEFRGVPPCRTSATRELLPLRHREHTLVSVVMVAPDESKRRHTILVAEDDTGLRDVVAEILQSSGYEVVPVDDGKQAIDYLNMAEEASAAVLLDLMMPVVNGWDCLHMMRSDDRLWSIPIVVMSEAEQGGMGADMFLRRPFRVDDLLETIDHFARGASSRRDGPGRS